jgi:hypothetical protein
MMTARGYACVAWCALAVFFVGFVWIAGQLPLVALALAFLFCYAVNAAAQDAIALMP